MEQRLFESSNPRTEVNDGSRMFASSSAALEPNPTLDHRQIPGPNPFLVDDPDDPLTDSDTEDDAELGQPSELSLGRSEVTVPPQEIALTPSIPDASFRSTPERETGSTPSAKPVNIQKQVHPPPVEPDDNEAPDFYIPGLVLPTMFLPIPNTDPLTTLLMKYIPSPDLRPVRDTTGEWQNCDFHTLVMADRWRALARMARDRLVQTSPQEISLILNLWYIRLSSLARLRLFNQTSAECTNLFTVLYAVEPPSSRAWLLNHILPFELEVMHIRLKYWAGDHLGYLDALSGLLASCREKARVAADESAQSMWKERGARVTLMIASQMIEMKDYSAATKLLEPLCNQIGNDGSSHALRSAIARIYLQVGNLKQASKQVAIVEADPDVALSIKRMNKALLASAKGEWSVATEDLQSFLQDGPVDAVAANHLAVAYLSQGKLQDAIDVMEKALMATPESVTAAEPFLFNLSTLYELHSTTAWDKKRGLLIEVAKHSGDGLKTTCLKLPTN